VDENGFKTFVFQNLFLPSYKDLPPMLRFKAYVERTVGQRTSSLRTLAPRVPGVPVIRTMSPTPEGAGAEGT
jgi:hypothetical protein